MTPTAALKRAAALLEEDALAGYQSCEVLSDPPKAWACTDCVRIDGICTAKAAHDERMRLAASLRLLANR